MQLKEIFDTELSITWNRKDNKKWKGYFEINKKIFVLYIMKLEDENDFSTELLSYLDLEEESDAWEVRFAEEKFGNIITYATGKKDQFIVFSTVLKGLILWAKTVKPKIVIFSADEKSRIKLYQHMIKKFASLVNYKLLFTKNVNTEYFVLEKI